MDANTTIEALGEGAKAATKLGAIIEKIFGPCWTRKQADADAYAAEKRIQTIRNNPDMEIVYIDGKLNVRQCSQEVLAFRAEQRMLTDAIRQENNIEKVLEITAKELPDDTMISEEPVNDDWIVRFFNIVKEVSNEDMQQVWGKILAGEIKKPGSFSYRTIETIRNLSQSEATVFQKLMPFIMSYGGTCFFSSDDILLRQYDIYYADILLLQECGLVNMSLSNNPKVSKTQNSFLYSDTIFMNFLGRTDKEEKITFGVHALTSAGKELYDILAHTSSKEYAIKWAEKIFEKNKNKVSIFLYDVNSISDTTINHNSKPFQTFVDEQ